MDVKFGAIEATDGDRNARALLSRVSKAAPFAYHILLGVFFNCDAMIGGEFGRGLQALKQTVEEK